jgi:ApaG protein
MIEALFPYVRRTQEVTIRVAVNYQHTQDNRWFWSYHIRIENDGEQAVQLLYRHWEIEDGEGTCHTVDGEGVVGEQPVVAPNASYDYVSGCPLNTPHGSMQGAFHMRRADGTMFKAHIPRFELMLPTVRG